MIDRLYLFALIAILFVQYFYLAAAAWMFMLLLACVISVPLFTFEALTQVFAPRLQRDLSVFRHKPKRGVQKLISHLSLDLPRTPDELKDRAQQVAKAAHAVTMRHPNPIYGPIRLKRLEQALDPSLLPANRDFLRELRKAWIAPKPGLSPGGLILHLRAALGRLLFGRWLAVARRQSLTGATSVITGPKSHSSDEPWKTRDYPDVMTFLAWQGFAEANDLRPFGSDPLWLPLAHQRMLAAITAQLHGTRTQALLARLMNPSHFSALQKFVEDRARWDPWATAEKKVEAQQAAERAERQSYRAKDSLSPEEVTALVAAQAQDSILLNRVWPPGATARGNSWLGGLPCLPRDMEWPRNRKCGLPLHFLAQVDCADLPTLNGTSPLPRDGLLLFFSDLDEERIDEYDEGKNAVVYVPKSRQSVTPRALPNDLPEIDHSSGKPSIYSDEPGRRHYPKWPVVPTAVKTWGGETEAEPKTFNYDYLDQSRAAHEASLAAVMPPPASSTRTSEIFPTRQRKNAEGKIIVTADGKAHPYTAFEPEALPEGFPFCGAGIDAFVNRLQQQATKATRQAASVRSMTDAKWNDTEEKRSRKRAEAEQAEDHAREYAELARQAREVLGTLAAHATVPPETIGRLHHWLSQMIDKTRAQLREMQNAVSGSILDLTRAAVTEPGLLSLLPTSVYEMHATSLVPSTRHSQHLMLGPAQRKTNSTAWSGVRLLCLDSDYGLGMMYCDCGVLEYWIAPEDLAALRFDRAVAQTAGG